MFAVTFTANRDSRWLYEILQFLFENIEELNDQEFAIRFKDFLEKMAVRYAEGKMFTEEDIIKNMVTFLFMHLILLITSYGKIVKS